jgi:hypothetical protein
VAFLGFTKPFALDIFSTKWAEIDVETFRDIPFSLVISFGSVKFAISNTFFESITTESKWFSLGFSLFHNG